MSTRIFAISDLHVDFAVNLEQVESLSRSDYRRDTLIVAGDASHRLDRAEAALTALGSASYRSSSRSEITTCGWMTNRRHRVTAR